METPAVDVPTAIAANLLRVRRLRNLTVRELSDRLSELGAPMLPSGITKIEKATRQVSAAELLTFALALNVSPSDLLDSGDALLEIAPGVPPEKSATVREWIAGYWAIPATADLKQFRDAAPAWFREGEERKEATFRHPAMGSLNALSAYLTGAILGSDEVEPAALADALRRESKRLASYVGLLAGEIEQE